MPLRPDESSEDYIVGLLPSRARRSMGRGMSVENEHFLARMNRSIETRTPIDHHLATIQIEEDSDHSCVLHWSTEIEPDIFAEAIHQGMLISIEGIKKVIK